MARPPCGKTMRVRLSAWAMLTADFGALQPRDANCWRTPSAPPSAPEASTIRNERPVNKAPLGATASTTVGAGAEAMVMVGLAGAGAWATTIAGLGGAGGPPSSTGVGAATAAATEVGR